MWTHETIANRIKEQIRLRKKSERKPDLKKALRRFCKIFYHRVISQSHRRDMGSRKKGNLGFDEFGRDLDQGIKEYVAILKRRGLTVHTVLVLGSRAKLRWKPESDLDVMVVASDLPRKGRFGLKRLLALSDRPIYMGVEASGCNKEEFLYLLRNFNLWTLDAIYYGKVVFDDGFWSVAKNAFQEMETKYQLERIPLKQMLLEI